MEAARLDADVAVVGAGFAGLAAARELAAGGLEPLLLDARDRVGGRVFDRPIGDGAVMELGAGFVGPGQDRMLALTEAVGVETFQTHTGGRNLLESGGRYIRYRGTIPRLRPLALLDAGQTMFRLDRLARRVEREEPWRTRRAEELDGQTFSDWIERHVRTKQVRGLLAVPCKTLWGAEPDELSFLYTGAYVRAAGGLNRLLDTPGGAQESRFVGGPHLVARRVAAELGDRVRLESAVVRIEQAEHTARVRTPRRDLIVRRVIVAVPPPLAAQIEFEPPPPPPRAELCRLMRMGALMKCFAVYPEPFWREDGLTGEALSDRGPATITFDTSPPSGSPGVLLGFVGGGEARALSARPEAERGAAVIEGFARLFGERARRPDEWVIQDWPSEPWSGGGPVAYMPPGTMARVGPALRKPHGLVHWAGTETATRWTGYMDGAVRSGERAAAEVLATAGSVSG
ncbi:MAG: FAD-dependent oxidoreductase [Actinobacteria bacterium]|nr:FAD-dependent oxidoreductase [Actinomycetota bacterium]